MATSTYHRPASLEFTTHPEANELIAQDPAAFVIGWILDQQIKVQFAFQGPWKLKERLGSIEPKFIAKMDEQAFVDVMTEKPAIHRFGGAIGKRIHACMKYIVEHYDGDAEQIWIDVTSYDELRQRLLELPGFGEGKVPAVAATLARRFGLPISGFEDELMPYGSLSEVVEYQDLLDYQARKGEYKKQLKAAKAKKNGK